MNKKDRSSGICPMCGSDNLDYGDMEILDDEIYYEYICEDCGDTGNEYYDLVFTTIISSSER